MLGSSAISRTALCCLLVALAAGGATAQSGGSESETTPLADLFPDGTFTVAFQALDSSGLGASGSYLRQNVPRLLAQEIQAVTSHHVSAEERDAYIELYRERRSADAGATVDELRRRQSDVLFNSDAPHERREQRRELREDIEEAEAALRAAQRAPVIFPQRVPVSVTDTAQLLPAERSPLRLAREHDAELVIGGRIESLQDYAHLSIYAYHRALKRRVVTVETTALAEELGSRLEPIMREISTAVLGRAWATLVIEAEPGESVIYVDDELAGVGSARLRYLPPGEYRVRAELPAGRSAEKQVTLSANETQEMRLAVPLPASEQITLYSSPEGADVYAGALWQGLTPLTLSRPEETRALLLEKEGYDSVKLLLAPVDAAERRVELFPDVREETEVVTERRDAFYRALGFFALSVPVPIILYGVYDNRAALFAGGVPPSLDLAEQRRIVRVANSFYWSSLGAATVSVSLLVNVVVRLAQYVQASEHAHFR